MDEKKLFFCNFLKLIAQEQLLLQKNIFLGGVKGISCLERKGLNYLKGATMFP